ncbi:MAG: hypothetical protein MUC96_07635 [Myxococcaceae bacterium]|nr:hypothetical protein [Myxococcaceae bacterium]
MTEAARPIRQHDAFRSQLSALGDVISKLSSLCTAASGLGTSGVPKERPSPSSTGLVDVAPCAGGRGARR